MRLRPAVGWTGRAEASRGPEANGNFEITAEGDKSRVPKSLQLRESLNYTLPSYR